MEKNGHFAWGGTHVLTIETWNIHSRWDQGIKDKNTHIHSRDLWRQVVLTPLTTGGVRRYSSAWAITHQTHTHIVVWRQGQHIISHYMRVLVSEHVRTYCQRGYKCLSSRHALWDGVRTAGRPVSVTDCSWSKLAQPAWPSPHGVCAQSQSVLHQNKKVPKIKC